MKVLTLASLTLMPLFSFGQLIDELPKDESGNLYYNEVVQIAGKDRESLYLVAKQFFVDAFKSANDVVQFEDKATGVITGKGFSNVSVKIMGISNVNQMWFTLKIQCKDGRYKCEVYDIYFNSSPDPNNRRVATNYANDIFDKTKYYRNNGKPNSISEQFKDETNRTVKNLFASLRTAMNKELSKDKKDDW
jgi:hypothetical protein